MAYIRCMAFAIAAIPLASHLMAQAPTRPTGGQVLTALRSDGLAATPSPLVAFEGCPDLDDWQKDVFLELQAADLSPEDERTLAFIWSGALTVCRDPRLAGWFVDRLQTSIEAELGEDHELPFWFAMDVDLPIIRKGLRAMTSRPEYSQRVRGLASGKLFSKLSLPERRAEFLLLFETGAVSASTAVAQLPRLVSSREDDSFVRDVAEAIRSRPDLAQTAAAEQVSGLAAVRAGAEARAALSDALVAASAQLDMDSAAAARVQQMIRILHVPKK